MKVVTKQVSTDQAQQLEAAGVARPALTRSALAYGPAGGYTPTQLAKAYGVNPGGATSQTVAIVDAYDDPSAKPDLNAFDTRYGLPTETSTSFKKVFIDSAGAPTTTAPPTDIGWAGEITLDIDAVRGLCHRCKILLVEANSNSNGDLGAAVNYAAAHAKIVSNSYGGPETDPQNTPAVKADYNHPDVAVLASTGDDGWYGWDHINVGAAPDDAPSAPSGYDTVVAVGGTTLNLNADGTRAAESVWNDNGAFDAIGNAIGQFYGFEAGAAGSGCSSIYAPKLWQKKVAGYGTLGCGTQRNGVDIASEADYFTGYDTYETAAWCSGTDGKGNTCPGGNPGWQTIGGTSLSSPSIAAMWALAGGPGGVKYPALTLYGHYKSDRSHLFDVAVGGTGGCDTAAPAACSGFFGGGNVNQDVGGWVDCAWDASHSTPINPKPYQCYANKGYDGVSGVGTPKGLSPFKPMSPKAVITRPSSITHGHAASFSGSKSSSPFPGGSITSYSWNWGDNSGSGSTLPGATHTYAHAGTYHVTLTVTDTYTSQNNGRVGKTTITITVT